LKHPVPDIAADCQRWIEQSLSMIEMTRNQWPTIPEARYPAVFSGLGGYVRTIALGHLLLGELPEARHWFRESAGHFLKGLPPDETQVAGQFRGLEAAILTGDREFAGQVAAATAELAAKRKPAEYPYLMFLKETLLGREDAGQWAREAAAVSPTTVKNRGGYGTLGALCQAVYQRDGAQVQAALEGLLAEHKAKARGAAASLPEGRVCVPGAALAVLAQFLAIPVAVESPYIPAILLT
jgi:hypothetical protein